MKRRTFISMLAGTAGALALPAWRKPDPTTFLPPAESYGFVTVKKDVVVTEEMLDRIGRQYARALAESMMQTKIVTTANLLKPGLIPVWETGYRRHPVDWRAVFP